MNTNIILQPTFLSLFHAVHVLIVANQAHTAHHLQQKLEVHVHQQRTLLPPRVPILQQLYFCPAFEQSNSVII